MKKQFLKQLVIVSATLACLISLAAATIVKVPAGSQQPEKKAVTFDGVWAGKGNITLIKQLDGFIILQGKDSTSTWSARGIIQGSTAVCRGNGITNKGVQFIYESTITLKGKTLLDSWKAVFIGGKEIKGKEMLEKVKIKTSGSIPKPS